VLRLGHITFACEDTRAVAEFWAAVLGYEVVSSDADWFARGEGPELFFKRMRKSPTIELPIHLDVNVPDREVEVNRIIGLGAKLVETKTSEAGELKETSRCCATQRETGSVCKAPTRVGRTRTWVT
jgi:hypothetical protein